MEQNTIRCELCGMVCMMQISGSHLKVRHGMTTAEYRALGHSTLSPARLAQLRQTPVGKGQVGHPRGEDHWNYKGGHLGRNGYWVLCKNGKKAIYEHREVAEQMLGRPLEPDEVVHHKDGNRVNNDPENLQVMTSAEHNKIEKPGLRAYFNTGPDCEEAARLLHSLGWSKNKIERALRVSHHTITSWLSKETH